MSDKYYVYKVFVNDEIIYVGKGKGKRYEHTLSGCSHNDKLNEFYFRNKLLGEEKPYTEVFPMFDEEMAIAAEHMLILIHDPVCNKSLKTTKPDWYKCDIDQEIRDFVRDELPFTDCHWSNLLPFTSLSERQLSYMYSEVCEYEHLSTTDILSVATNSSIIYNKKVSCELVNALVVCRDYKAGI